MPVTRERLYGEHHVRPYSSVPSQKRSAHWCFLGHKKYGYWTAKSLIDNKFQGEIHLISRSGGEILGQPTYPDILSVPGEVDLAIIAIAPKHILPIIEQCVEKGVKTGSSFPPVLAKRVPKARKSNAGCWRSPAKGNMRIMGPNCMGMYSSAVSPEREHH